MASPVRRWLIDAAQRIDAALGPARVKRIVLPPQVDQPGKEGEFCAVQLDCGSVGLAFTLLDGTLAALHARGADSGRAAMDLVRGYAEGDGAARALGLAAINALTRRLYDRAGFVPDDSVDSFGSLGLKAGDRLGMVGHFTPLIEQARALGIPSPCWN
jgi:GNAT superfamily N-acetyltransferase